MRTQHQSGIRRHFTYANVMSTAAVFLLLAGGTAYAATAAKNSVRSSSVKDNSLKSKDLKDNQAVGSPDVIDNSLTGADINESTLVLPTPPPTPAPSPAPNSIGSANVVDNSLTADDLAAGSVRSSELGAITRVQTTVSVAAGASGTALATCPAGSLAISGGARNGNGTVLLGLSKENVTEAWVDTITNTSSSAQNATAFVYCLAP